MYKEDIQRVYNQIHNLTQYRDKSEGEIWEIAEKRAIIIDKDLDISIKFKKADEKKLAKDLLRKYLEDYSIESISDKNTLKEVIYLEVVQNRLQDRLNYFYDKESKAIPMEIVDIIHKNSHAILSFKNTLGLNKSKEKKTSRDVLEDLKKRAKKWREENQASRTLPCSHCGKMILLKIRTEMWEAQKHPFFKDKRLYNKHLVKLYKDKVITREDVAKVLECSVDYIGWIMEKIEKPEDSTTPAEQVLETPAKQVAKPQTEPRSGEVEKSGEDEK